MVSKKRIFSSFIEKLSITFNKEFSLFKKLSNNFPEESKPNNIENKNNDKTDISKGSDQDIFGDEQAFPFIAGLGKNAAH